MATKTDRHLSAVTDAGSEYATLDSSYPAKYLECRSLQHRWRLLGFFRANGEIVRALVCERCNMDRHDRWGATGYRYGATYSQPDGYRIGNGGASAWEVRQEVLNRVTIYDSAMAMQAAIFGVAEKGTG
jgi:hypothetical protein